MHLLILNWKDVKNPDVGGAEIILYELAKRLINIGHTVSWFSRSFPGGKKEEYIDDIHVVRRGNRFSVYFEAYRFYQSLKKKPDKVLDCVNTICWQTPLYVPKEKRLVYVNQLAKEVLFYELPPLLSHIAYFLEPIEYLTYHTSKFLCYSPSVKRDLETFGVSSKNIHTFKIGIDHDRYRPGKKSPDPLFVFVARLTKMKRPDMCVAAMKILIQKYPQTKLAIVGYGPMERRIADMIHSMSLEANVFLVNKDNFFLNKHVKDNKVSLMQQAWALLIPSVKEGWGLVVTEAGSCGTPSIATNVTGLMDSVEHQKTGIIISSNPTPQELSSAMEKLLVDVSKRNAYGNAARKKSLEYTWDAAFSAFSKLL